MKKTLAILGTILLVLILSTTVAKAVTAQELIDYISQPHKIAKTTKQISASQKVELERFLTVERPVTDEEATKIKEKIETGIDIMNKVGTADLDKLSLSDYNKIKTLAEEVEAILGNTEFKIVHSEKAVYPYINGVKKSPVHYGDDALANTGVNHTAYIVASVLAIFAVATVIIVKKRAVNA